MNKKNLRLALIGLGGYLAYKLFKKKPTSQVSAKELTSDALPLGGLTYSKFDAIEELEAGGYDFDKGYFAQTASAGLLDKVRKKRKYTYKGGSGKSQARAFFDSLQRHYDKYN